MLTVEKIGGTSMSRFAEVIDNIIVAGQNPAEVKSRIFVVSAYGGVTNLLLEHKKNKEPGVYTLFAENRDYRAKLDEVLGALKKINRSFASLGLPLAEADHWVEDRVHRTADYLESMFHVLSSGYIERSNILLAAREMLASIGEAHAAWNSAAILKKLGCPAVFVDLGDLDDTASLTIDERIHQALTRFDPRESLPIVTGYTKGIEGIMRAYDRGYSEITFSKIAVAVGAQEAVIHKEFHLSSADPAVVGPGKSVIVGATNFDVADQLADVGMEAIHPRASKPLEIAGIALRVKNAFDPAHPGTLITRDYVSRENRLEIITGSDQVSIVEIHDPSMVGAVGFDMDLLAVFRKHDVSYILKATNANSISHVVWEKSVTRAFLDELAGEYAVVVDRPAAVVCAIGSNIAKPGILVRATKALADAGVNVLCVSQSLRQVNMQFVVERSDYTVAVRALNEALCLSGH